MHSNFSKNISPSVLSELNQALEAKQNGDFSKEFSHLENAHVIGQESTYWHVKVHVLMLVWALRNKKSKEVFGQVFRIIGAATKTAFGLVPQGNTGGSNISPFKVMSIKAQHKAIIEKAKNGV